MANRNASLSPATVFARPTPGRVWLGSIQRTALSWLMASSPLKRLLGPRSSGKTVLLAHARARLLAEDAVVLRCAGPTADAAGVLSTLLHDAELGSWHLGESDQRNLLAVFIEQRRLEDQRVIIMVDRAHRLGADAWEELDRLRRFSLDGSPAVELVVAATPGTPGTGKLADWAGEAAAATLQSASPEDVTAYIGWRFRQHEMANPFRPVAMRLIARLSGGRYGTIDALCQMAMILMRQRGAMSADARLIQQAMDRLTALRTARTGRFSWPATGIEAAAGRS